MKGKNDLPTPKKKFKIAKILTLQKTMKIRSGKENQTQRKYFRQFERKNPEVIWYVQGCETPIKKLMFLKKICQK